jgi:hypothetical protein
LALNVPSFTDCAILTTNLAWDFWIDDAITSGASSRLSNHSVTSGILPLFCAALINPNQPLLRFAVIASAPSSIIACAACWAFVGSSKSPVKVDRILMFGLA